MVLDFLRGFGSGFKLFGRTVSGVVNIVLLSIVYFVGVGATSIVCKLRGKKFLDLKIDKNKESYWEDSKIEKKDYHRMF